MVSRISILLPQNLYQVLSNLNLVLVFQLFEGSEAFGYRQPQAQEVLEMKSAKGLNHLNQNLEPRLIQLSKFHASFQMNLRQAIFSWPSLFYFESNLVILVLYTTLFPKQFKSFE
jgi:hypothetical protein